METEFRKLRRKTGRTMDQMANFFSINYYLWQEWERGEKDTPENVLVSVNLYICNRKNHAKTEKQERQILDLEEKLQRSEELQKEISESWAKEVNERESNETRQLEKKLKEAREEINLLQAKLCGVKP